MQFLDEPVETWFRETFKPSQDEVAMFIRTLTPTCRRECLRRIDATTADARGR